MTSSHVDYRQARNDTGVWLRRAPSAVDWGCSHLVRHWLQGLLFELSLTGRIPIDEKPMVPRRRTSHRDHSDSDPTADKSQRIQSRLSDRHPSAGRCYYQEHSNRTTRKYRLAYCLSARDPLRAAALGLESA